MTIFLIFITLLFALASLLPLLEDDLNQCGCIDHRG